MVILGILFVFSVTGHFAAGSNEKFVRDSTRKIFGHVISK